MQRRIVCGVTGLLALCLLLSATVWVAAAGEQVPLHWLIIMLTLCSCATTVAGATLPLDYRAAGALIWLSWHDRGIQPPAPPR